MQHQIKKTSPFEGLYAGQMISNPHLTQEKYWIEIHSKDFIVTTVKDYRHDTFFAETIGVKVFLRYDEISLPDVTAKVQSGDSIFDCVEVVQGMNHNAPMDFWLSLNVRNKDSNGDEFNWGDGLSMNTPKILREIGLIEKIRKLTDC